MKEELEGKVAHVLSDRALVINRGAEHGVQEGDVVLLWDVVDVKDPDTGDILGTVKSTKVQLTVSEVQERISVAGVQVTSYAFGSALFRAEPEKKLAAVGGVGSVASATDTVRVKVGEEATVRMNRKGDPQRPIAAAG